MNRCQKLSNKIVPSDSCEVDIGQRKLGNICVLELEYKHKSKIIGTS